MRTQRYQFEREIEGASPQTVEFLKNAFRAILESDKDYTRKADYIGFSMASIDDKIESLDEEIKELHELKRRLKEAKEIAQRAGAEVFAEYGIERLEGAGISSITLTEAKTKRTETLRITNEAKLVALGIVKSVVDTDRVKELLCSAAWREVILPYADIEIVHEQTPARLRINKRKGCGKADLLLEDSKEAA